MKQSEEDKNFGKDLDKFLLSPDSPNKLSEVAEEEFDDERSNDSNGDKFYETNLSISH